MTERVLITCPNLLNVIDDYRQRFATAGIEIETPEIEQQLSEPELVEIIDGFDGVIAGDDPFTRNVFARADRLRIVSKWGVGVDNIDHQAAAEHGVIVTNTPGVFDEEVADVCVGYLVMLARGLHEIDRGVRRGAWPKPLGTSLAGKRLGIIGLGGIGQALGRRALTMRMRVSGTEISAARREEAAQIGIEPLELDELLVTSDIISLNCPLTPSTYHLLDPSAFEGMRGGTWIINTARGALIEENALVDALRSGVVDRAALDVFEDEPLPPDSPLRSVERVILGSHNASNTREAVWRVNELAIDNLLRGLEQA